MSKYDPRADRARRSAALDRPELRDRTPYIRASDRKPEKGRSCWGWAADGDGSYKLPFPVVLKNDDRWYNTRHDRPLEVKIVGWTYHA